MQLKVTFTKLCNKVNLSDFTGGAQVQVASVNGSVSSSRVGSASTSNNGRIYIFFGRGGVAMAPVDEHGSVWEYNPSAGTWTLLRTNSPSYPPARSYHCMASDGHSTIYVHAGCPETGRLSDLWAFNIANQTWKQLADGPLPQWGGTSIASTNGKLIRMIQMSD